MSSKHFTGPAHGPTDTLGDLGDLKTLIGGGKKAVKLAEKSINTMLSQTRSQLASAEQARYRAIERHDRILTTHRTTIERLEKQLEEFKKAERTKRAIPPQKPAKKTVGKKAKKVIKKAGKKR